MLSRRKNRRRIDQAAVRAATRSTALRAGGMVSSALAFAVIVALTAWGAWAGRRYLHQAPTFAIERITFEGTSRASEEELLRLGGLALGDNLFEADLLDSARAMAAHPWVQRVSLEREYPRGLTVRVIEHVPVALADLGGLYYVDEQGKAFKKLSPNEDADFPILGGFSREDYALRAEPIEALFRGALEALEIYRDVGLEKRAPVSQVLVSETEGLTFFCGKEAVAVRLGTGEWREKFSRLDTLFSELSRRGARAEVIRLDNRARPGWVAVQLAGVGEVKP